MSTQIVPDVSLRAGTGIRPSRNHRYAVYGCTRFTHARSASSTRVADPGISRVGMVYTPPEFRGHGYASANVAAASQHALDQGADACMLHTDLANPTSNRIYQALGYRPVGDAQQRWFS